MPDECAPQPTMPVPDFTASAVWPRSCSACRVAVLHAAPRTNWGVNFLPTHAVPPHALSSPHRDTTSKTARLGCAGATDCQASGAQSAWHGSSHVAGRLLWQGSVGRACTGSPASHQCLPPPPPAAACTLRTLRMYRPRREPSLGGGSSGDACQARVRSQDTLLALELQGEDMGRRGG